MNPSEVRILLEREQGRWFSKGAGVSNAELLRRRERLFNGLTLAFGAAVLPSSFLTGAFGGWGSFCLLGEIWVARRCSVMANECRDAREFLGRLPSAGDDCEASG